MPELKECTKHLARAPVADSCHPCQCTACTNMQILFKPGRILAALPQANLSKARHTDCSYFGHALIPGQVEHGAFDALRTAGSGVQRAYWRCFDIAAVMAARMLGVK